MKINVFAAAAALFIAAGLCSCSKKADGKVMEQHIESDGTYMNVIKFGNGKKNLAVLSGVSLCGLEGMGGQIEAALADFTQNFTVYVFDRKKVLPDGYTMEQMADDIYNCLCRLGVKKTSVYGASQGGMFAQIMAVKHPEMVENLVLCSTAAKIEAGGKVFTDWGNAAINHDVVKLNSLFLEYVYSDAFKESIKEYIPALLQNGTAADCDRFLILLKSMEGFDITERLSEIKCPVLVMYDKNDKVIPYTEGQRLAQLTGGKEIVYDMYSHAVYDEAPDLKQKIVEFCR